MDEPPVRKKLAGNRVSRPPGIRATSFLMLWKMFACEACASVYIVRSVLNAAESAECLVFDHWVVIVGCGSPWLTSGSLPTCGERRQPRAGEWGTEKNYFPLPHFATVSVSGAMTPPPPNAIAVISWRCLKHTHTHTHTHTHLHSAEIVKSWST